MSRSDKRATGNKTTQKVIIGVLVAVLLIIAGYSYRSMHYTDRFLPNTLVENINVSDLTLADANEKIQERYRQAEFTLTDSAQEWKTINKTSFGLQADFSDDLKKIQDNQNQWLWGSSYLTGQKNHTLSDAAFDEEQLAQETDALKEELDALNEDREPTKNASITKSEDGFSITPETIGDELDTEKIIAAIKEELLAGQDSLELEDYRKEATVTSEDEELNKELTELNKIAQVNASYTINGETFQIPTETITGWLTYSDGKADVERDKVREYVSELGEKYNTSTNPSQFDSTRRGTVTVPAGSLSWTISTENETDGLIEEILAGEDFTRSPVSQGSTNSGSALFGSTYIEVDLQNQHMWYYRDGEVVLETDIVSGKPSTATPTGVFYVWNKERNATLRGSNGDGTNYATPVDYWMPIDWTGIGIHDSSWQPTYGGDYWQTGGSHGCVNTPPSVMSTLFEKVDVGTPVLVI